MDIVLTRILECMGNRYGAGKDLSRMEALNALKRKHNASLEEIIAYGQELEERLQPFLFETPAGDCRVL